MGTNEFVNVLAKNPIQNDNAIADIHAESGTKTRSEHDDPLPMDVISSSNTSAHHQLALHKMELGSRQSWADIADKEEGWQFASAKKKRGKTKNLHVLIGKRPQMRYVSQ